MQPPSKRQEAHQLLSPQTSLPSKVCNSGRSQQVELVGLQGP